jgi:DNA-binding CsgD family transcriptional regulator
MSRAAAPLAMSDKQREVLETLSRSRSAAHRVVQRARVLLLAADGVSNSEISEVCGVSRPTVLAWRNQFDKEGLTGFTSSSWLNLVERWFRDLTDKAIRRGIFHSVNDLIAAIEDYLKANNDNPKPFIWTANAEQILAKVARGRVALQQVENQ